jgi:hypothetical protein
LDRSTALILCFNALSLREPVSTSLENAKLYSGGRAKRPSFPADTALTLFGPFERVGLAG